jgi:hypothetical protein
MDKIAAIFGLLLAILFLAAHWRFSFYLIRVGRAIFTGDLTSVTLRAEMNPYFGCVLMSCGCIGAMFVTVVSIGVLLAILRIILGHQIVSFMP